MLWVLATIWQQASSTESTHTMTAISLTMLWVLATIWQQASSTESTHTMTAISPIIF
jgi:hypothetical protein